MVNAAHIVVVCCSCQFKWRREKVQNRSQFDLPVANRHTHERFEPLCCRAVLLRWATCSSVCVLIVVLRDSRVPRSDSRLQSSRAQCSDSSALLSAAVCSFVLVITDGSARNPLLISVVLLSVRTRLGFRSILSLSHHRNVATSRHRQHEAAGGAA